MSVERTAEKNIPWAEFNVGGLNARALMEVAQLIITPGVLLSAFIFFWREAKNGREELRNELKAHRRELKDEISSVRVEVAGVRNEICDVRNEIHDMNGRLGNVEGILTTLRR